jgi:septal ring factor EnvC (AmiA/AmiB activator)
MNKAIYCRKKYLTALIIFLFSLLSYSNAFCFFNKIYNAQKKIIREAQKSVEGSINSVAKNVEKTEKVIKEDKIAEKQINEGTEKDDRIDNLTKRNESLVKALEEAKSDQEKMKEELDRYSNVFEILNNKNEKAGNKAEWLTSGFYFSLIANLLAVTTFFLNRPKRKLELKKIEIETEIAMLKLENLKNNNNK